MISRVRMARQPAAMGLLQGFKEAGGALYWMQAASCCPFVEWRDEYLELLAYPGERVNPITYRYYAVHKLDA